MMRSEGFLMNFEMSGNLIKHAYGPECLMYHLKARLKQNRRWRIKIFEMYDRCKSLLELDQLLVSLEACCLDLKLFSLPFDATMRQRSNR